MSDSGDDRLAIARAVRDACVSEALETWQRAGMSGLCTEGRWELVIDRLRHMEPEELLPDAGKQHS